MRRTIVCMVNLIILKEVYANLMETDGTAGEEAWLALAYPYCLLISSSQ